MALVTIGIDTGGTFTDVVAVDDAGHLWGTKLPSTPADFSGGFLAAVEAVRTAHPSVSIRALRHGTTVATNALLEERLPPVGLIVTHGFREILETTRYASPGEQEGEHLRRKPAPLVPLEFVREVRERVDAQGVVHLGLDRDEVQTLAQWFRSQRLPTIAVSLLHSYVNPVHECQVKDILQATWNEATVVLSADVLPEAREYERTVTTCLTAALMPVLRDYLDKLQQRMHERGWHAPLLVMQSSGGLIGAAAAMQKPLTTALSGPSAAVVGMSWLGTRAGFPHLVTLDMGGTSTDVALVKDGSPLVTTSGQVHVYPMKLPAVDIVSIGAGGGSIAWWGTEGRLHVGPRSAGAEPGPVCYARGGHNVTVTDAHLILGRLPASLLGGALPLDQAAAEIALAEFGGNKKLTAVEAASGILQIVNHNMCGAVRQISVRRGHDPRAHTLLAMGGAGPLHATELAELLGISTIVIPPSPGLAAAWGLLVADYKVDFAQTLLQREPALDLEQITRTILILEQQAWDALVKEGVPAAQRRLLPAVDFRYRDLSTEWTIALRAEVVTRETISQAIEDFHQLHQRMSGHSHRGQREVELTRLRVSAIGVQPKPRLALVPDATEPLTPARQRQVFFLNRRAFLDCPIYAREALGAKATITGPAIIEQYDSTTVVSPDWQLLVDSIGNLVLKR